MYINAAFDCSADQIVIKSQQIYLFLNDTNSIPICECVCVCVCVMAYRRIYIKIDTIKYCARYKCDFLMVFCQINLASFNCSNSFCFC